MKNKVLIKLIVPELNESYDLFIPVNEYIWKIIKLSVTAIADLSRGTLDVNKDYYLINKDNGNIYQNNQIVINTEIRNSTELILLTNNTEKNYDRGLRMNIYAKKQ